MPADISSRILNFIDGKLEFPIMAKHELMASFYLFGRILELVLLNYQPQLIWQREL